MDAPTLPSLKQIREFDLGLSARAMESVSRAEQRNDEDSNNGLEIEKEDEAIILHPFDPQQIRIRTAYPVVELLVTRIKHGEIDLAPEFQRHNGIWTLTNQSRLIESLLLRIPIPVFYVAADEVERWSVVDGIQRMSSINRFVKGEFALKRLEYMKRWDGSRYNELPCSLQRRINETPLIFNIIEPGTPPEVTFNVFRRINTGGANLNSQEIRHALNPGPVRQFLAQLAQSDEFITATDASINKTRMKDRECILRFLSFLVTPSSELSAKNLDSFLTDAMKQINEMRDSDRETLADTFRKAMTDAFKIFGSQAFRRPPASTSRYPVNVALFETWSFQLARCTQTEIDCLVERRDEVQKRFEERLLQDSEFDRSISFSTANQNRILKRFQTIKELIEETIS